MLCVYEERPDPSVLVSRETGADRVAHGTPQRTRAIFIPVWDLGKGQLAPLGTWEKCDAGSNLSQTKNQILP